MTEWEISCLSWYLINVNPFTFKAGTLGDFIRDLELTGEKRRFFLKAVNLIYTAYETIQVERQNEASRKHNEDLMRRR